MSYERMNRHFGGTSTPTTLPRCVRRMPGFKSFWFSDTVPRLRGRTDHFLHQHHRAAVGEPTRLGTMSNYVNFVSSLLMSGEETVIIPMPFLPEEDRRHGPERLMVNGGPLVWRMLYRNTIGAEGAFPRIKPSSID